jgi:hypothetical protein
MNAPTFQPCPPALVSDAVRALDQELERALIVLANCRQRAREIGTPDALALEASLFRPLMDVAGAKGRFRG